RAEAGDTLTVAVPPAAPSRVEAQDLPLTVVFEDDAVAVVDKPAGMVVHPAPGHADGTLVNALLHHLDGLSSVGGEQRPGLVHRLDRGTSGLLVVAKTDVAHRSLAAQFADHSAGRVYLAWVHDPPDRDRGRIESRLARHPTDRLRFASTAEADRGRRAVTHWEVRGRAGTVGLVTCRLETGRTHQVRVHLSELGAPLLGDRLYARRGASAVPSRLREAVDPSGDRPLLHAWTLAFVHPTTGAALRFVAPPPPDIVRVGAILGIPLETP
ncbi:MAG: RluA family pseudouridine synthase, partial [Myxococcota bacterium]